MEPFVLENNQYFVIKEWMGKNPGLTAGFTVKNQFQSEKRTPNFNFGFHVADNPEDVCSNKQKLSGLLDFPLSDWVGARQTHEIHIKKATVGDKGKGSFRYDDACKRTDGFYTFDTGVLLTLCFADCVPLYFIEPKRKVIGIAHAGWKGTVNGISAEMISTLVQEGIEPEEIFAVIGPSICGKCYIVDDRVINLVQNRLEDVEKKPYNQIKANQYALNLKQLNKLILISSGVKEENILVTEFCTSCHSDLFFSHRRDNGKTGRMMGFIGWREVL